MSIGVGYAQQTWGINEYLHTVGPPSTMLSEHYASQHFVNYKDQVFSGHVYSDQSHPPRYIAKRT